MWTLIRNIISSAALISLWWQRLRACYPISRHKYLKGFIGDSMGEAQLNTMKSECRKIDTESLKCNKLGWVAELHFMMRSSALFVERATFPTAILSPEWRDAPISIYCTFRLSIHSLFFTRVRTWIYENSFTWNLSYSLTESCLVFSLANNLTCTTKPLTYLL